MALKDVFRGETRSLKVTVYVGGVDEVPERHVFCPSGKDAKAVVRSRVTVEVEAVTIETPCESGVICEPAGIGRFVES